MESEMWQEKLRNLARVEFDLTEFRNSLSFGEYETKREVYTQQRIAGIERYQQDKREKCLETNLVILMLERIHKKIYNSLIPNKREYKERMREFISDYLRLIEHSEKSLTDYILELEEFLK